MADDCVLVMEEGLREGQAFKDEVVITSATSSQTDKPPPRHPKCVHRDTHRCTEGKLPTRSPVVNAGRRTCGFSLYCSLIALLKVGGQAHLRGLCQCDLPSVLAPSAGRPELSEVFKTGSQMKNSCKEKPSLDMRFLFRL